MANSKDTMNSNVSSSLPLLFMKDSQTHLSLHYGTKDQ